MFASDAATFLVDFGTSVVWTSSLATPKPLGLMLFDQPDTDIQSGEVVSREYQVTFEAAAWPGLKRGDVLSINGGSFTLRANPHLGEDGVFSKVMLTKV